MVGRDAELAQLLEAFARAEAGEAQVAVVTGEAGIGKTRLVREFVAELPDEAVVAFGHAVPLSGDAMAYGLVADLLRSLVREVHAKTVTDILGAGARVLAPLVPRLGDGEDRSVDRLALFAATQDLLADLAAERAVVLVLEDGHWADLPSLDLVAFWARTLVAGRLLLLITLRDAELTPDRLERIDRMRAGAVGISLTELPFDEIAAQVRSVRPDASPAEIAEVQRLSHGVPLFVEELAENADGARSTTVRAHLAARLHSLDDEHARLLEVAAHETRTFSAEDLSIVAGVAQPFADAAIDAAWTAGLLEPAESRWRFRHELLRLAAVESSAPSARVAAHHAWARHLGASPEPDDLVAAADHEKALGVSPSYLTARIKAAEAVWARGARPQARDQWLEALSTAQNLRPGAHDAELDVILGSLGATGVTWADVRDEILNRVTAEPDSLRALHLRLLRFAASVWGERVTSSTPSPGELLAARHRLEGEPPSMLAYTTSFNLLQCLWILQDYDGMRATIPVAQQVCRGLPDQLTSASSAFAEWQLFTLVGIEHEQARRELVEENLRAAESLDTRSRVWALVTAANELMSEGDFRGVMRHVETGFSLIPGPEVDDFWYLVAGHASNASLALGDWDTVLEMAATASSIRDPSHRRLLRWLGGLVEARRGSPDAIGTASLLRDDMTAAGWPAPHDVADTVEAEALMRHDPRRARALVAEHLGRSESTLYDPSNGDWMGPAWNLAAMLAWRDDTSDADYRSSVEDTSRQALRNTSAGLIWRREIAAHLARAEGRDSLDQWRAVVRSWDRAAVPYQAAIARVRVAELLVADQETGPAAQVLGEALSAAETIGARPLGDEIRTLASRARLKLPGHEPVQGETGPLTTREHEVLQLLVQGMTNDQIGTTLFMSPRTASVHVSHILQKLGAGNRTEVAAIAHRRGLVTVEG
jgi:DNA-binding CsgD family transcriptional regulator